MIDYLTYFTFLAIAYWAAIGAYIALRWGLVGVRWIWSKREEIDRAVLEEISERHYTR